MLITFRPTMAALPAKFHTFYNKSAVLSRTQFSFKANFSCNGIKKEITEKPTQGFSALSSDIPWEREDIWSILAMYMFILHVPLGTGGLSIVAYLLNQPVLDPQTEALSLLILQSLELSGALILLKSTAKTEHELLSFFKSANSSKKRNPVFASALGFGFLMSLVFLTSMSFATKDANNPILKEILVSSNVSKTACVLVYCLVTPVLEEIMYRGFLLTSLGSSMGWQRTVFLSSVAFSTAHFSVENFLQLFIVGCVLGCCYSWTGNLKSSIVVHSLYNALILMITLAS